MPAWELTFKNIGPDKYSAHKTVNAPDLRHAELIALDQCLDHLTSSDVTIQCYVGSTYHVFARYHQVGTVKIEPLIQTQRTHYVHTPNLD